MKVEMTMDEVRGAIWNRNYKFSCFKLSSTFTNVSHKKKKHCDRGINNLVVNERMTKNQINLFALSANLEIDLKRVDRSRAIFLSHFS